MIDINELRRLAQAATPGPWIGAGPSFGESLPKYLNEVVVDREGDEDDGYSVCTTPVGLEEQCSDDMAFIAAANPAAISELLDRLEAAEKERDELLAGLDEWLDKTKWVQQGINEGTISAKYLGLHRADVMTSLLGEAEKERDDVAQQLVQSEQGKRKISEECDELRAKIEAMERQGPVAWLHETRRDSDVVTDAVKHVWGKVAVGSMAAYSIPLYTLPGAKGEEK